MSSWQRDTYAGDADATAAADWLENQVMRTVVERAEAWQRALDDEPPEWRRAANFSDYWLDLSPEQLLALQADIDEVVERYRGAGPAPGSRRIILYTYALPRVDK